MATLCEPPWWGTSGSSWWAGCVSAGEHRSMPNNDISKIYHPKLSHIYIRYENYFKYTNAQFTPGPRSHLCLGRVDHLSTFLSFFPRLLAYRCHEACRRSTRTQKTLANATILCALQHQTTVGAGPWGTHLFHTSHEPVRPHFCWTYLESQRVPFSTAIPQRYSPPEVLLCTTSTFDLTEDFLGGCRDLQEKRSCGLLTFYRSRGFSLEEATPSTWWTTFNRLLSNGESFWFRQGRLGLPCP